MALLRSTFFSRQAAGILILLLVLAPAACSPIGKLKRQTQQLVRRIHTADKNLTKRVALLPVLNTTRLNESGLESYFQGRFAQQTAATCPDLTLLSPGKPGYPELLLHVPRRQSGRFDNMAMAVFSRRAGLNATVQPFIAEIRPTREATGIMWFRKVPFFIHLGIGLEAYDPLTGAKILDKAFTDRVEVATQDAEAILKGEINGPGPLAGALDKAAEQLAEALCDSMAATRWNGFIISEPGQPVTLSAGSSAGLAPGMEFAVRRGNEIATGAQDQRFFMPGPVIGHVRVTSVTETSAVCELLDGEIEPGAFVEAKQD